MSLHTHTKKIKQKKIKDIDVTYNKPLIVFNYHSNDNAQSKIPNDNLISQVALSAATGTYIQTVLCVCFFVCLCDVCVCVCFAMLKKK